jgi:glycine oxidase
MADVVIVGGGVIGLTTAFELAEQGASVRVLEQGACGREASWAGAGILPPGNPQFAQTPEARLRAHSHVLWPELSEKLVSQTGIDNGYRNCGGLSIDLDASSDRVEEEIAFWTSERVDVERLTIDEARNLEPALSPEIATAFRLPALSQVRNPRHLKALLAACVARRVELVEGAHVVGFDLQNGRVKSATTLTGDSYSADRFCVTGGAWTQSLLRPYGVESHIEPVRGQIVLLSISAGFLKHVVEDGRRYLVPRPDGRVLVGSTEEHVGFNRRTTASSIAALIRFAVQRVPPLADATVERTWAGLRPGSLDELPCIGGVPGVENLFVAAGHFRSGLQMSPFTAVLLRQLVLGHEPSISLEPYACDRHAREHVEKPTRRVGWASSNPPQAR